jgi:hypothetical protein
MKFKIAVTNGTAQWQEEYDYPEVKSQADAEERAAQVIQAFNATLREGEKPRKLVSVGSVSPGSDHVFESCQAANDALGPCPRALADSDGGHWWYVDHEAEEDAIGDDEKDFIHCECKSCPQKMRLSADADEIPL